MIYGIAERSDTSIVKIGFTSGSPTINAVRGRLSQHQVSTWRELSIIAIAPGCQYDERQLHALFSAHRVRGEWFKNEGPVAEWIQSHAASYSFERRRGVDVARARRAALRSIRGRARHFAEPSTVAQGPAWKDQFKQALREQRAKRVRARLGLPSVGEGIG